MSETAQSKRGGKAFHSILEPHFDFIREQRQRRMTWLEIAGLLASEKGIQVTLYAPYQFYRRKLKRRAKGHWEDAENHPSSPPVHPNLTASRPQSKSAPLPPPQTFKRPDRETINSESNFT